MDDLRALKRRVLREAVRENVDVIKGRYRFKKPSKSQRAQMLARAFFFLTLPLALFFSSYLIASVAGELFERQASDAAARTAPVTSDSPLERWDEGGSAHAPGSGMGARDLSPLSREQVAELRAAPAIGADAFPLEVKRVIIDPGHGGENLGTSAESGLVEKDLALDISNRLGDLLKQSDFDVAFTRRGDDFISLEDRAAFANSRRGDLFISIHLNWLETLEVRGVETYFLGPTNDPYLTQLAAEENRDSGYSLADFRGMIDRVYAGVRQSESRRFASSVQQSLYNALRKVNPQLQDRGVKKAPFIVLVGTEMPAILAEVSCLSNEQEARLLMTPEYRQYIAEALFEGVDSYARQVSGGEQMGS